MWAYAVIATVLAMASVDTWQYVTSSLQTNLAAGSVAAFYFVDLDYRQVKAGERTRAAWQLAGLAFFTGVLVSIGILPLMVLAHLVLEQFGYWPRN